MRRANSNAPLRTLIHRLGLVAVSVLLTLLVVEITYRGALFAGLGKKAAGPAFRAVSASIYEFDAEFGYRYATGRTSTAVEVVNGRPVRGNTATVNRYGGIGPAPADDSPVKVLAFGDSFTANPLQPVAWPEFVSEAPEFDVLNCGRDGYGLLQMIHLAAAKNREIQPDLIIVAFITEDLLRDRFWRATVEENGRSTILVSTTATPAPDRSSAAELALVDPEITPEWLRSLPPDHPEQDPIFRRLCDRFRTAYRGFHVSRILSPARSLVLNRIRFGDPYHGSYSPARNPRTSLRNFADDPSFVADLASIHVPMALVLLPKHGELAAGHHFLDAQSQELLASLEELTGTPVIRLMDFMNRNAGNSDGLFLLPDDQHPSPQGARVYAAAMLRMLRERVKIVEAGAPYSEKVLPGRSD